MIDLHTHSTFSDGSLTPEELAQEAARVGLTAVALTDHDNMGGLPSFLPACRAVGTEGIPGVELSLEAGPATMHLLGYFVRPDHPELQAALAQVLDGRDGRNRVILRRLNELGLELTWEEVAQFAGEDIVGRPHFAQALIRLGYVRDKQQAFDRWLAKGKPGYVDRFRLIPAEGLRLIRAAGGVPVLAHPLTLGLSNVKLEALVRELQAGGLEGIEARYSEHTPEVERQCLDLARRLDLVATGGSDFHGAINPAIRLGSGFGNVCVPDEVVEQLRARIPRT